MVNTRILEQRLGWRAGGKPDGDEPSRRALAHEPLLQGRVRPVPSNSQPVRRAGTDALWASLSKVAETLDDGSNGGGPHLFALDRHGPAAAALDQLRTQLVRVAKANGWRRIGVTSPGDGCGRTAIAAGLAASVARLDYLRVLLVDMDLAAPGLAPALGIRAPGPIEAFLDGRVPAEEQVQRVGDNLALLLNDRPVPQSGEVVHDPDFILKIRGLIDQLAPDLVVYDLPPLLGEGTAVGLLPQLDAVLLVADGTRTVARDIIECERLLEGQVPLLGVVLNKSEDADLRGRALSPR